MSTPPPHRASTDVEPALVVGAGPTGLATALLLAHRGIRARVIERAGERVPRSKALLINPRSLQLLDHTGVSDAIREAGHPVTGMRLWHGSERATARLRFDAGGARRRERSPLPYVLTQTATERLLEDALRVAGVEVERQVELLDVRDDPTEASVGCELRHADGSVEQVDAAVVVGADGHRSRVRQALGIGFPGTTYDRPFGLADVRLGATPLDADAANLLVLPDGGMLAIRIEGDLWRLAGTISDPLARLPTGTHVGEVVWQSTFDVSHRVAARMSSGRCALAGDAAHVHSPFGGRGMNLGIEDAYVLATLVAEDRLDAYDHLRRPVDRRVTNRVRRMTDMGRSASPVARAARRAAPMLAPALLPFVGGPARRWAFGLDHPVELFER